MESLGLAILVQCGICFAGLVVTLVAVYPR